jgi:hypothetical protein
MFKKLFLFGVAAGLGYLVFSNPQTRKRITQNIERGRLIIVKAIDEVQREASKQQEELTVAVEKGEIS